MWGGRAGTLKIMFKYLPLQQEANIAKQRITEVTTFIATNMLQTSWQELDYRFDLCRVTRGGEGRGERVGGGGV